MKPGDLVRVKVKDESINCHKRPHKAVYRLALLIIHYKWERMVTVLINGELKRYRVCDVTRAGRRDQEFIGGTL